MKTYLRQNKTVTKIDLLNVTKNQTHISNFDIIIDEFSHLYATSLTNILQRKFTIHKISLEIKKNKTIFEQFNNCWAFGIFDMIPLQKNTDSTNNAFVIYDNKLTFSILEIMLGAEKNTEPLYANRQLTSIETSLIKLTMSKMIIALKNSFSQFFEIDINLLKVGRDIRQIPIEFSIDKSISVKLKIMENKEVGHLWIVFPLNILHPLQPQLKDLLKVRSQKNNTCQDVCRMQMLNIPVTVIAQSGELTMTIGDLANIKKGDILEFDHRYDSPLRVLVENSHKFNAMAEIHNGKKVIKLTDI